MHVRDLKAHPKFLLPIAAIVIATLWGVAYTVREYSLRQLADNSQTRLSWHRRNLEDVLKTYAFLPDLLARSEAILGLSRNPGDRRAADRASGYARNFKQVTKASAVYVLDRHGHLLASSESDAHLLFIDDQHAVRPYFENALSGLRDKYISLSPVTKRPFIYFFSPVLDETIGRTLAVAVVRVDAGEIEEAWRRSGEIVMVSDLDGVALLASNESYRFTVVDEAPSPQLSRNLEAGRYGPRAPAPLPIEQRRALRPGVQSLALAGSSAGTRHFVTSSSVIPASVWIMHVYTNAAAVARNVTLAVVFSLLVIVIALFLGMIVLQRRANLRQRRRHEQREKQFLIDSEEETRLMIDNAQIGLIATDLTGRLERLNPLAEQIVGHVQSDGRRASVIECFAEESQPALASFLDQSRSGVHADMQQAWFSRELCCRNAAGEPTPVQVSAKIVMMHGSPKLLFTLQDLTELKRSEAALRKAHTLLEEKVRERTAELTRANARMQQEIEERIRAEAEREQIEEELIQAAKMAVVGQMAAGITHEINQPLSAIMTYSDNATKLLQLKRYDDLPENLARIAKLVSRMGRITNQLRAFSRKSDGVITRVSMRRAVDEILLLLDARLKREGIDVVWKSNTARDIVKGDVIRIEQVVLNLLNNAIDAVKDREPRFIWLDLENRDQRVVLRVRDSGAGFDDEVRERLFQPFFTTKEIGQGLGLGLAIASSIVENFGGQIRAECSEGGGAVFAVELPVYG